MPVAGESACQAMQQIHANIQKLYEIVMYTDLNCYLWKKFGWVELCAHANICRPCHAFRQRLWRVRPKLATHVRITSNHSQYVHDSAVELFRHYCCSQEPPSLMIWFHSHEDHFFLMIQEQVEIRTLAPGTKMWPSEWGSHALHVHNCMILRILSPFCQSIAGFQPTGDANANGIQTVTESYPKNP